MQTAYAPIHDSTDIPRGGHPALSSFSDPEFDTLARVLSDSAFEVEWFAIDVELGEEIIGSLDNQGILNAVFHQRARLSDRIKSLHLPHDVIPASLHPADQDA